MAQMAKIEMEKKKDKTPNCCMECS